jgi:hypothetical protein
VSGSISATFSLACRRRRASSWFSRACTNPRLVLKFGGCDTNPFKIVHCEDSQSVWISIEWNIISISSMIGTHTLVRKGYTNKYAFNFIFTVTLLDCPRFFNNRIRCRLGIFFMLYSVLRQNFGGAFPLFSGCIFFSACLLFSYTCIRRISVKCYQNFVSGQGRV